MIRVQIKNSYEERSVRRRELRKRASRTLKLVIERELGLIDGEVSLSFVEDEEMRELNRKYRDKDSTTDVLSFPMDGALARSNKALSMRHVLGDIVISIPEALRNAASDGREPLEEIEALLVHGALHLLGYDHIEPADSAVMKAREKDMLATLREAADE